MERLLRSAIFAIGLMLFPGCGHNVVTYSDGVGFETTLRPDNGNIGVLFRYGKILTAAVRENSHVEMTGDGKGEGGESSGGASASGSVKLKVGRQISGYYVDAIKAGATPDDLEKYTTPMAEK